MMRVFTVIGILFWTLSADAAESGLTEYIHPSLRSDLERFKKSLKKKKILTTNTSRVLFVNKKAEFIYSSVNEWEDETGFVDIRYVSDQDVMMYRLAGVTSTMERPREEAIFRYFLLNRGWQLSASRDVGDLKRIYVGLSRSGIILHFSIGQRSFSYVLRNLTKDEQRLFAKFARRKKGRLHSEHCTTHRIIDGFVQKTGSFVVIHIEVPLLWYNLEKGGAPDCNKESAAFRVEFSGAEPVVVFLGNAISSS